jgi:hypothetical protein
MHYILYKYGGVFMDFDWVCIKPLDELAYRYTYFSAFEPPAPFSAQPLSSVAIIGATQHNSIIYGMR